MGGFGEFRRCHRCKLCLQSALLARGFPLALCSRLLAAACQALHLWARGHGTKRLPVETGLPKISAPPRLGGCSPVLLWLCGAATPDNSRSSAPLSVLRHTAGTFHQNNALAMFLLAWLPRKVLLGQPFPRIQGQLFFLVA